MTTRSGYGYSYATPITAPALSGLTPAQSTVLTADQAVQFDVTVAPPASLASADGGRFIVWVKYPDLDNKTEIVYDGAAFSSTFDDASTYTAISNGFRFVVYRNGGWLSAPTFFVHANTDLGGVNV